MIYCFDLDGTLCEQTRLDYDKAHPYKDRIQIVNGLYDEGHHIIIDTARGSSFKKDWYDITKNQLDSWGLKYHELRTGVKLSADIYVDDKGKNAEDFFKRNDY